MAKRSLQKEQYAAALREMMTKVDFEEITVSALCEMTRTNRHTFYYHFKDKYALVEWIYTDLVEGVLSKTNGFLGIEESIQIMDQIRANLPFYQKAMVIGGQNAMAQFATNYMIQSITKMIKTYRPNVKMTLKLQTHIEYHCYGVTGILFKWVQTGCVLPSRDVMNLLVGSGPNILKKILIEREMLNKEKKPSSADSVPVENT